MKTRKDFIFCLFIFTMCSLPMSILEIHAYLHTGENPFTASLFYFALFLIIIAFLFSGGVKWVKSIWLNDQKYEAVFLFAAGAVSWTFSLLFSGILFRKSIAVPFHDTYYVFPEIFILYAGLFFLGGFCFLYYYLIIMRKYQLEIMMSRFHFWISYWGLYFLYFFYWSHQSHYGAPSEPNPRVYIKIPTAVSGWAELQHDRNAEIILYGLGISVIVAQLVFILNLTYRQFSKTKTVR